MRIVPLAALAFVACAPLVVTASPSPSATREPAAPSVSASPSAAATPISTPSPAPAPTPSPPPRVTRPFAGVDYALATAGAVEARIEAAISRDDERVIVAAIGADVPAVEREFERSFAGRPVVYVFATTESYAQGLAAIFGYGAATAEFVAENSISFFEPSLRLIAVNWAAVEGRRPIAAIRHELTHLLTLDACAPRCDLVPAWLNEGQARLAEAMVAGGEWRHLRVRYEAAAMAETGTLLPMSSLISQASWNALVDWAGYFKYQQSARVVELVREDIGTAAPIARLYERLRLGRNVAQAYADLTGRSFEDFVAGLPARMRAAVPASKGMVAVESEGLPPSYLLYGFAPGATLDLTVSGPRGSETTPLVISPFGSTFDGIPPTRGRGGYTVTAREGSTLFTVKLRRTAAGDSHDTR